jgi:hypothetical protein
MTEAERKLLLWCGMMLSRGHSLMPEEIKEVEDLIAVIMDKIPPSGIPGAVAVDGPVVEKEDK